VKPDPSFSREVDSPLSEGPGASGGLADITVLIPVYECADRMDEHRKLMRKLAPLIGEMLWVATRSIDGSHELARQAAKETGGQYLEVPPGLYAAWNAGITKASRRYLYISTVGEEISVEGLSSMRSLMMQWEADICFSPPRIEPESAPALRATRHWPIFRFERNLRQYRNRVVPVPLLARLQVLSGISCLLGSCASCIFRTAVFHRNPFPVDYGHYGDTVWWHQNLVSAKTIYHSNVISSFHVHDFSQRTIRRQDLEQCLEILIFDYQNRFPNSYLPVWARQLQNSRDRLDNLRGAHPARFWWLDPRAWFWRTRRSWIQLKILNFRFC